MDWMNDPNAKVVQLPDDGPSVFNGGFKPDAWLAEKAEDGLKYLVDAYWETGVGSMARSAAHAAIHKLVPLVAFLTYRHENACEYREIEAILAGGPDAFRAWKREWDEGVRKTTGGDASAAQSNAPVHGPPAATGPQNSPDPLERVAYLFMSSARLFALDAADIKSNTTPEMEDDLMKRGMAAYGEWKKAWSR